MLLALAFVPERDVQFALEIIDENFPHELLPLVEYWEKTYVGKRMHNLRSRYDINIWNMFDRMLTDQGRTTS